MSKGEIVVGSPAGTVDSKGLKGGALGLVSSVVVGMASTAPAYSLAATLGLIVASGRQPACRRKGTGDRAARVHPDVPERRRVPGTE